MSVTRERIKKMEAELAAAKAEERAARVRVETMLSVRVPQTTAAALDVRAAFFEMTRSELLRRIVEEHLMKTPVRMETRP